MQSPYEASTPNINDSDTVTTTRTPRVNFTRLQRANRPEHHAVASSRKSWYPRLLTHALRTLLQQAKALVRGPATRTSHLYHQVQRARQSYYLAPHSLSTQSANTSSRYKNSHSLRTQHSRSSPHCDYSKPGDHARYVVILDTSFTSHWLKASFKSRAL
jgi:hypothetical protein